MNTKFERCEVSFNVELQSTRPDGYRRGGYSLSRGINHLSNVTHAALYLLQRDASLIVLNATPTPASAALACSDSNQSSGVALENAGAQLLGADAGELSPEQSLAALIAQLTPEQFTQSGLPDLKALSALAGHNVSAHERDAAFSLYQSTRGNALPSSADGVGDGAEHPGADTAAEHEAK